MRKKTNIALSVMAALATATIPPVVAQEVSELDLEEIVVTGIRASLEQGLSKKENADSIVDGAFAEELGKFPDTNVAESLQRITGVAITRARGGEGQFVTVRGLGEEFNAVTYNGRVLATENAGREFSFDVIASELIAAAEVYKTTTASQGDGSIGGLVNIRSALPLDNVGFHAAGKLAAPYETLNDSFGTTASGVISNSWADDTIGLLGSFSYQQRDTRTDVAESIGLTTIDDLNGNGIGERVNSLSAGVALQERERIGGTVALQYLPNDNTEIVVDALYTKYESPSSINSYSFFPAASGVVPGSVTVSDDDVAIGHTTSPTNAEFLTRFNEADTETSALGFNLKQQFSDKLSGDFDLSWSKAEGQRDNVGSGAGSGKFYVLQIFEGQFTKTPGGGAIPIANFTANDGAGNQIPFSQISADQIDLSFSRNTFVETEDEVVSLKADFDYAMSDSTSLKFGVDYVDREKSNQAFDNSATWCGDSATVFFCGPGQILTDTNSAARVSFFDDDFLNSGGGSIPSVIPVFSIADVERSLNNLAASFNTPSFLAVNPDLASSNVIEESILGAYLQADFEGTWGNVPFRANAGVRVAKTELTSTGFGAQIVSAVFEDARAGVDPIQTFNVNSTAPSLTKNDYTDVLPAFNITFDLTENSKFRASLSQTLSRPTLTDLSTFFSVTSSNFGAEQITQSNPLLEPVRSNNLDLSYEYYGEDGISYSIAGFYKDISDFITNQNVRQNITIDNVTNTTGGVIAPITRDFLVSGPQNGDTAKVYGAEIAAQYLAISGFGIAGNLTLADSEATSGGMDSDLENISDLSANLSVFYEGEKVQARVSANYRSDFLANTAGEGGLEEIVDDYTQVDLSVSYKLGSVFGDGDLYVFMEGVNVFEEDFYRYAETKNLLETYEVNGGRWTFGVRGSF